MTTLLAGKNAVIYGAAGGIGRTVARIFVAEGARVFLAGRTGAKVQALAAELRGSGGQAEAVELDATDEPPVVDHLDEVVRAVGSVDVSFNLVSRGDVQGMQREDLTAVDPNAPTVEQLHAMISGMALLCRAPKAREIADVAAFLASDRASGMTTGIANVTCGLVTG
jgi:NAD(P)-dependent dehydrogenase (short-subunit alcohol dehydrogenase family)